MSTTALPASAIELRAQVREFLAGYAQTWTAFDRAHSWTAFDRDFSRAVGRRGWIGMTWPAPYGAGRTAFDRFVLQEEMLAAGAPVGAHWVADRQSGPLLLKVGTEEQKQRYLPGIASGDISFCIGMSEPNAGSDLAAIEARAERDGDGWRLNGTKLWTTNAQHCQVMIGLFRTTGSAREARQGGLTQFLIELDSPGVEVRPIPDLNGDAHFNEVAFTDVYVPGERLLGTEGQGWAQVTSELALERSGSERFLSAFPLVGAATRALNASPADAFERGDLATLGTLVAETAVLRSLSLMAAGKLERGEDPSYHAVITKDLGAELEQRTAPAVRSLFIDPPADLRRAIDYTVRAAPTFSLRGGAREILRGITARALGVR
ncbi:acyl-CoA dehydrogenase [Sphingomonas panacis]|uniref:Acyl-CoA dehydrogenase n=1 Tax=Sphingomonas panacis TaxID=1560345 RepID=A0A1B3ZEN9_9SPHN|nr:acyl-CoA dehydrogenase family protein [Sphingomonas panacis]AOH85884.1 acyl-CoA dehydrogenase [Sphingomonas panacis]